MKSGNVCCGLVVSALLSSYRGCIHKTVDYYSVADFGKVSEIDAHFHCNTPDIRYMEYAGSLNFRFISPNVDAGKSIDGQVEIARRIRNHFPGKFIFPGTFSVDRFNSAGFADQTIARIQKCMKGGASGFANLKYEQTN